MNNNNVREYVSLKPFSTFDIGGKARFLTIVTNQEAMKEAFLFGQERNLPILCLGRGSNTLFHDEGFRGLVVVNRLCSLVNKEGFFEVGSGFSFSQLGRLSAKENWSGLEFAAGIPASVGGAIYMNAGANGQETKDSLVSVTTLTKDGTSRLYEKKELSFGYRTSSFQETKETILSACFQLHQSPHALKTMQEKLEYRMKTQPYSEKSIGCFFKNPPGTSAGRLIEEAGLKGVSIGGAAVSTIHANFIVNRGNATAKEVVALAHEIVQTVLKKTGIRLESEARSIDPDGNIVSVMALS